jgi:hypothetical protein
MPRLEICEAFHADSGPGHFHETDKLKALAVGSP